MNNLEFVEKVKDILSEPTVFAYGAYGEEVDDNFIAKTYLTQRHKYHSDENILKLKEHYGKYAYECSAIITKPLGIQDPPDVNGIYKLAKKKSLIEDMEDVPGICVYFLGHVGVYIGNGQVIESTYSPQFGFGVVITNLSERPWTTAFELPWIEYLKGD